MKEKGFIIDKDGKLTTFGVHGLPQTTESGHKRTFEKDIVDTSYFESLNIFYNKETSVYSNALRLSRENGIIFVFNQQLNNFAPTQVYSYAPDSPTKQQLLTLELKKEELDKSEIVRIGVYYSDNYVDVKEYDSFNDYIIEKQQIKSGDSSEENMHKK